MKKLENMTEPELKRLMIECGDSLRQVLGRETQFVLVVFDDPKVAQYIATCERGSMIEAMRETANRLEAKQDIPR